jgi:hypothetical protein
MTIFAAPSPSTEYVEWEGDSASVTNRNNPLWYLGTPVKRIVGFKILSATIPFSFYTITSSNNTFILNDPTNTNTTITIPPGNYTAYTICATLSSLLDAVSAGGYTYLTSYDSSTGKISTVDGNTPYTFTFSNTLSTILGFGTGVATDVAGVMTAPNVLQITGPSYLIMHSSELGILNTMSFLRDSVSSGTAVCQIPINANPSGTIYYTDPDPMHYFECQGETLNKIDLFMTLGNSASTDPAIDLNGLSFSVKIGFAVEAPSSTLSHQSTSFRTMNPGPTG